jgi:hypothetical protein
MIDQILGVTSESHPAPWGGRMLIGRWIVRYGTGSAERVADSFEGEPLSGESARHLARILQGLGLRASAVFVP